MALHKTSTRVLAFIVYFIFSTLLNGALAIIPNPQPIDICFYACYDWTDHITWDIPASLASSDNYYDTLCAVKLKLQSIYVCAQTYCSDDEIASGLNKLNITCMEEVSISLPDFETLALPLDQLAGVPRVSRAFSESKLVDYMLIPDRSYWELSVRTDDAFYRNIWWSWDLSYSLYGFWAVVMIVGMMSRIIWIIKDIRLRSQTDTSRRMIPFKPWEWIRRNLLLPAAFRERCQYPVGWSTIPPRLESLVILMYFIYNLIICFPGYTLFYDNLYFGAGDIQLSRYIADRTGILSLAQFPIMWLFSTRNNPFIWLTGWQFTTFNNFHRWVARISFMQAFAHAVAWTENYRLPPGGEESYYASWPERWFWCGGVATVVMSFILAFSIYPIRMRAYDLFLVAHILFAVVFLVTMWYHIAVMGGLYNGFIWFCVATWVLDRAARYTRIIISSLLSRSARSMKAIATYDSNGDIVRLDVTTMLGQKHITPGYYYYVYTPANLRGYESHPFTLCSWRASSSNGSSAIKNGNEVKEPRTEETGGHIHQSFLIRPYSGFTSRLRSSALKNGDSKTSLSQTILLEGPYGNNLDLSRYSNVLVVAGGSGISIAVSHAYHLLTSSSTQAQAQGTSFHIVWAVPQRSLVDSICKNELAGVLDHERFSMTVYVTGESGSENASAKHGEYTLHFGRPDVFNVMRVARQVCKRDLAIVTCGTPGMADDCRRSVVRLLKEDDAVEVAYFNETMTW